MSSYRLDRRGLLRAVGASAVIAAAPAAAVVTGRAARAAIPPVRADIGVSAYPFELGQVQLTASRWLDNMNRTLAYLRFVDVDRLLYNFRANHGLSIMGAAACGGWEAPNFEFRRHSQGHFLTAWSQAWAVLGDTACRDKAHYVVAELAKCQAAGGFNAGLPVRIPGVRPEHRGGRRAPGGAVLLHPQDARRSAGRLALHRQHAGAGRPAAVRGVGRLAHRPADLQPDADHDEHRVRGHERRPGRRVPADRRRALAHRGAAVRPCRRHQPAGIQCGSAQRPAR